MSKKIQASQMENWKPVLGYEDVYDVSDWGRVRSVPRRCPTASGTRRVPGGLLQPNIDTNGYHGVMMGSRRALIHRLVLEAFAGPCPEGMEACHNDGDKGNNGIKNLRWDTRARNLADRWNHGTMPIGGRNGNAKHSGSAIRRIRSMRRDGQSIAAIARATDIPKSTVRDIVNGRIRAWVSD